MLIHGLDSVAEKIRQELEQSPGKTFTVIAYAAIFPGLPDPVILSRERADRVKKELIKRNIPVEKLESVTGGETSDFGLFREENRRIKILEK
jgi:outer membrane protein OmpA-like peptidoglycan-associated protein